MEGIFYPFTDPVTREGNKNNQANYFCSRTGASTARLAGGVTATAIRLVFDVHGDEGDGEPRAKN